MKKVLLSILVLVLLVAPWLVVRHLDAHSSLAFYCQVPYAINSQKDDNMLLKGSIKTHYYANGSGIGILSGTMQYQAREGDKPALYTIHRNTRFNWKVSHSYITTHTDSMHPAFGENIPATLAEEFIFPSFKTKFNDYYQIEKIANGDSIVSVANMPRLYCHSGA
ncbi:hypothetical protein [Buttiauxella sp. S04-F03]|uniref:hypothetical protein n=1 Tax=Buttiauxella sp. S04-F03 TaxID=2904525 RepID=UPI001E508A4A|nr:hypothetical protein [Buttiauxella sp. S04-F03]MCE0811553.1 hypothetical protein [Buttiauxella sp. S04-F03]